MQVAGWLESPGQFPHKAPMFNTGIISRIRQHLAVPLPASARTRPPNLAPVLGPPALVRKPDAVIEGVEFYLNGGVLLPTVPGLFSPQIVDTIKRGDYELQERDQLPGLLRSDDVVLEIGAGCGFMSTLVAKSLPARSVHCVEANPALIDVIRLTHRANQVEVDVHHEVLSDAGAEVDFYLHEDFWGSGTHSFLGKPIKVPATPFQHRLDAVRPTMIIVDIEGGEESLFDGADLRGVMKIMVELHQPTIGRRGVKRLFDTLAAREFHYDSWHSSRSVVTFSHVDRS